MKKSIILALAFLLSGSALFAERRKVDLGRDQDGNPIAPQSGGARYYRLTGTAEANPVDGPVVILGVELFNTGVPVYNAYAQIRDTDTGSDATVNIVAQFRFDLDSGNNAGKFTHPLYLESGFAVDMIGIAGQAEAVTVKYIDAREYP